MMINLVSPIFKSEYRKVRNRSRTGSILLMVIVVSAILFLGVITFSQLTLVESTSSRVNTRNAQSRALADSGTEYIKRFLANTLEQQQEAGGNYNNPAIFQGQIVLDGASPRDRGRFSILSSAVNSDGEIGTVRYGVEDESTKLNLNTLTFAEKQAAGSGTALLMTLPGMTTDVANAILDWIDEDEETREEGAESDFYTSLSPKPYSCKNGPLETLDELLSVRGVTPELLYGRDMNRNGIIDENEQKLPSLAESAGAPPEVDRGWSAYLTLYSVESNLKKDGTPRTNLNGDDLQTIHTDVSSATNQKYANFIILYRQYGAAQSTSGSGSGSGTGGSTGAGNSSGGNSQQSQPQALKQAAGITSGQSSSSGGQSGGQSSTTTQKTYKDAGEVAMDFTKPAKTKLNSVLDLIGVEIQITSSGGGTGTTSPGSSPSSGGAVVIQPGSRSSGSSGSSGGNSNSNTIYVKSPFTSDVGDMRQYLPLLGANMTTNAATSIPGRININQASKFILAGIPGMTPEILEQIIALRPENPNEIDEQFQYETWLLSEGACTVDQMKLILPFICGSGSAYRAQIVGYFDQDGPSSRVEMVINTSLGSPRVVFWRDMSHLGRGYKMTQLGATGE